MARLIHQLLHWAEARESQNYQYQPLYLTDVAEEVALYLNRLAVIFQVQIAVVEKSQPPLLHANRSTCFVLLKNLLENAIHHAPPHSVIELTITTLVSVCVIMAPAYHQSIYPGFYQVLARPSQAPSGAGLGLAICSEIAATHGWQLKASNSSPGACFSLQTSP